MACLASQLLVLLAALCSVHDAARILVVIPTPSISHQVVFRPLTQELARRGHEVVVVTTDPAFPKGQAPANLTEIDVHDISYKLWREQVLSSATTSGRSEDLITQMRVILPLLSKLFELQMLTPEVQEVLNNKTNHFDVIIAEASVRPTVSVSHVFKVPVIFASSFVGAMKNYDVMGAPMRPRLHYPAVLRQRIYDLSLWEKVKELYHDYLYEDMFATLELEDHNIIKRLFGPDTPTIRELENNVHLMLLNCHPLWDTNRPVPPSVVYMGGLHLKPPKDLPTELKSYLDSSKNGVIYVSFGTNVDPAALPQEKIDILIRVFSRLPYDVLWKWSRDEMPGRSNNIRISKWLPQADLLRHPKIKLFITQGGLQSTDEAITAGVPLIGMPMLGDQWFNVEKYVYHKIGIRQDMEMLTEEGLYNAVTTVLNDDSYRKNVVKLGVVMNDRPEKPLERAIWWIEHVIRHGGAPHLRARVANMDWREFLDLDLMAIAALLVIISLLVLAVALYTIVGYIRGYYVSLSANSKLKSS